MSIGQHEHVPYVTSASFDRLVIDSPIPALVNFQTAWSKPMVPLLGELAEAFGGRLRVVQVNTSVDPELAARFKIRAVPTLLIFQQGVPIEFIVGTVPSRFIVETVCKTLGISPRLIKARWARRVDRWPSLWKLAFDSSLAQDDVPKCDTVAGVFEGLTNSVQVGMPQPQELLPENDI